MEVVSEEDKNECRLRCILCCLSFQPGNVTPADENEQFVNGTTNGDHVMDGNNCGGEGGYYESHVKRFSKFCDEVVTTCTLTLRPAQQLTVIKNLPRFNSKLSCKNIGESGGVSVCSSCLKTVGVTMERKEKVDALECHVRSLQLEILRELRELEGILEDYNSGMGRIKEVVRRSDGGCLQFPMMEGSSNALRMEKELQSGISYLRECILEGPYLKCKNFTDNISVHQKIEALEVKIEVDDQDEDAPDLDFDYFPDNFNDNDDSDEDVKNVIVQPRKSVRTRKPVDAFIPENFRAPVTSYSQNMLGLGSDDFQKKTVTSKKVGSKTIGKAGTSTVKKESGRKKTYIFTPDNPPIAPPPRPGRCIRKSVRSRNGKLVKVVICCEICKFTTKKEPAFEQHLRDHETDDKPFQCTLCPSKFSTSAYLNFHVMGHQGHYTMCCDVCSKSVPFPELLFHIKSHASSTEDQVDAPEIIFCQNCSFCCTTQEAYTRHLGKHLAKKCLKEGRFKCHKCPEVCGSLTELNKHIDEKHEKLERFTCDWENCGKSFLSKDALFKHRHHHSVVKKEVRCKQCGKAYRYRKALNIHILKCHTKAIEKQFACKVCSKDEATFLTEDDLHTHEIREHGAPKLRCPACEKEFTSKKYLRIHFRNLHENHENKRFFSCEKCGKICSSKRSLRNHMTMHSEEKNYTCEECGKSFKRSMGLKFHMMGHRGEKNWKCGYCDKAFTRKDNLVLHERIHTGEKPYVCDSCGKAFNQKTSLTIHKRTQHIKEDSGEKASDEVGGEEVGATAVAVSSSDMPLSFSS